MNMFNNIAFKIAKEQAKLYEAAVLELINECGIDTSSMTALEIKNYMECYGFKLIEEDFVKENYENYLMRRRISLVKDNKEIAHKIIGIKYEYKI